MHIFSTEHNYPNTSLQISASRSQTILAFNMGIGMRTLLQSSHTIGGQLPKIIRKAAIIGGLVPLWWGVLSFVFFNARESVWTNTYWTIVYATCPFWYLPGDAGMILMPILNAGLYALVAAGLVTIRKGLKSA
jgi:hypothetical protein